MKSASITSDILSHQLPIVSWISLHSGQSD